MRLTDLERLRRKLGKTQEELAKDLGCSRPHISLIEGRWRGVFPEMALKILRRWECSELGITAETLMRGNRTSKRNRVAAAQAREARAS